MQSYNVHTIALQVPISDLTRFHDKPTSVVAPQSVIGVWTAAGRRPRGSSTPRRASTSATVPTSRSRGWGTRCSTRCSCRWRRRTCGTPALPASDKSFAKYVDKPELQGLLPVLYPGVFPNLAAYKKPRADLDAILLTGIPKGVVAGVPELHRATKADMLRLNVAIPPSSKPNNLGVVGGRPRRVPQRAPDRRRRRHHRAAGHRRGHDPAGGQVLHPRRRGHGRDRRDDQHQRGRHGLLPLPRAAGRGLPDRARHDAGVMTAPRRSRTRSPGRARSCSTSGATSARWW